MYYVTPKQQKQQHNDTRPPSSHDIEEVRKFIKVLPLQKKRGALQWIQSHCGIAGNQIAEQLLKRVQILSHSIVNNLAIDPKL